MTGGNAFIKIYPFLPYTGECCPCPSHNPSASIRATRTSCSENLRTWGDADKTAQCTFAGRGDAVYVEGLFPSTTVGGDQIIWGWSEDGETYARTNTYTIFSLRMFGDLNFDNIIDSIDYAAASSLTEHGWVMPVASNTLRKVELKTDLLIPGHLILSLTGDAQLRVWTTATPAANDTPLLITGQSITNGVDGASFGAYPVSTLYIEAISSGTATLTYSYVGTGNAEGFGYQAQLNLTAVKVELSLMWEMTNKANQVVNFTKKDDLPGCFSNKLYVVTDSSDNKYHVMVKANIEPSVLQSDFRCAVYKNDSKVSGSDKPFNSDGEVQLEFFDPMSDAAKTDFIVKIGYDQNSNGELNLAEYIEVVVNDGVGNNLGIPTIRGINQAQYASDSDDIDEMIDTGVMSIGTGLILPHESISNRGLLC